jgi:hypothetical protein
MQLGVVGFLVALVPWAAVLLGSLGVFCFS